jgi:YfiH family protein
MSPTGQIIEPDWPAPASVVALSTTRRGGYSSGPWQGFNLASHVDDDPQAVAANRQLLTSHLPPGSRIHWLEQVHGARVVRAGRDTPGVAADACWSDCPGVACAVLTADCLPVLFCNRSGDRVAAAHAGWRGLLEGVLEASIAALKTEPEQLLAWLGPAIGPTAFEVGPEVLDAFSAAAAKGDLAATRQCFQASRVLPGHFMADLAGLARIRLAACGLTSVHGGGLCTVSEPSRFFSYRRDGRTGRMASLILLVR